MDSIFLKVLSLCGVLIFAPLFIFTFSDPQLIEKAGRSFIESKLTSETKQKIDAIAVPQANKIELLLGSTAKKHRAEIEKRLEEIKEKLHQGLPELLSLEIAKLRDITCECRKKWQQNIKQSMEAKIASYETSLQSLINFSHVKYMEIVNKLTKDIRIFLGVNLFVFLTLFVVSTVKPAATRHLLLPSVLLVFSMSVCSYFYLFEQNWLFTIIYNDYTGFSYLGYLVLIFGLLCDIAFNKAKITTEIINTCLNAVGSAVSLVPC